MSRTLRYCLFDPDVDPSQRRLVSDEKDYAVVIFPPNDVIESIKDIRYRLDPDSQLIVPHVVVTFPFRTHLEPGEIAHVLREEVDAVGGGFRITMTYIADFYPSYPIIYWQLRQNDDLHEFCLRVHVRLDLPLPFKGFFPHLPLAREISPNRVMFIKEDLMGLVSETQFIAEAVELISPRLDGTWAPTRTITLTKD